MRNRIDIRKVRPEMHKATLELSESLSQSSLSPIQRYLIMIRTSQINSCAFCIDFHTREALSIGESQKRIFLLSAWKETSAFTEEEKALLALTEEVALIHQNGVSEQTYSKAEQYFSPEAIADIIMETVSMSGLNRIAVASHLGMH